jgi:hypothetical protein
MLVMLPAPSGDPSLTMLAVAIPLMHVMLPAVSGILMLAVAIAVPLMYVMLLAVS